MPPRPRCPSCKVQGLDKLETEIVGFYVEIYCKNCGDIHGVVAKPQQVPSQPNVTVKPAEKLKKEPLIIDMTPPRNSKPPAPPEAEAVVETQAVR